MIIRGGSEVVDVIFLGRGGEGAFTSSRILGIAASLYEHAYALSFPSFGPERRGAPVFAYTKINSEPIRDRSQSNTCDYFVILNESLYSEGLLSKLKEGGKLIINTSHPEKYIDDRIIPFEAIRLANEYLGRPIVNTAMLAALTIQSNLVSIESLEKAIQYDLSPKLAEKNKKLIEVIRESMVLGRNTKLSQITERSVLGEKDRLVDGIENLEIMYEKTNDLGGGEKHG